MNKFKTVIIAGGLAFLLNNVCVLLFLGGIFIGPMLLYPAIYIAVNMFEPGWLRIVALYTLGFFQFLIAFGVAIRLVLYLKKKPPSVM